MTIGGLRPRPAPLALTMGEPAGIGGELALKAWADRWMTGPEGRPSRGWVPYVDFSTAALAAPSRLLLT